MYADLQELLLIHDKVLQSQIMAQTAVEHISYPWQQAQWLVKGEGPINQTSQEWGSLEIEGC
jgi:hypothetical protein